MGPNPAEDPPVHPIADYFRRNWRFIEANRFLSIMIFVVGFAASSSLFEIFIIPGKDATIEGLRDGPKATPEQEQEIKSLREEVAALKKEEADRSANEWPALKDNQIRRWIMSLAPYKIDFFSIQTTPHETGADKLAESLSIIANNVCAAGVRNTNAIYTPQGIVVVGESKNPVTKVVLDLFFSCGYPVTFHEQPTPTEVVEISVNIGKK